MKWNGWTRHNYPIGSPEWRKGHETIKEVYYHPKRGYAEILLDPLLPRPNVSAVLADNERWSGFIISEARRWMKENGFKPCFSKISRRPA